VATNYPSSLDTFDTIASDKKTSDTVGGRTHRDMHNDLADAVEAVQAELGTDPAGAYATVKARFEAVEANTLPTIEAKGDLLVGTADNTYDNVTVGANNTVLVADSGQTAGVKWASTVGVWTVAGLRVGYTAKTGAYTATTSDDVIEVTSGTFTLDLPASNTCTGKTLKVKNSGTGVVTVDGNSAETVEGVATFPLGPGSYVEITSTGSAWILTGGVPSTGWRDVTPAAPTGWTSVSKITIIRRGARVEIRWAGVTDTAALGTLLSIPSGFAPGASHGAVAGSVINSSSGGTATATCYVGSGSSNLSVSRPASTQLAGSITYETTLAWPTSLPGSAA